MQKDIEIETFLYGFNEAEEYKYITAIEASKFNNKVLLFRQMPDGRKLIEEDTYTPFVYMKDPLVAGKNFKGNAQLPFLKAKHGIEVTLLNTGGYERMEKGYKYLVSSSKSQMDIIQFFKALDIKFWKNDFFFGMKPEEQFMIQKGVRLFKGMELYSDIHKLYWDIETQGLDPKRHRVFMIGLRDNKGYEDILVVEKENDDYEERRLIITFWYKVFQEIDPTMIIGFNSENFDFYFLLERARILGIDMEKLQTTKDKTLKEKLKRQSATLKLGGETEEYEKTVIWGMLNADLHHAVRKAKAIDSSIKKTGLKYIVKHKKVAKKDRMYIADGRNIAKFWFANENFVADDNNTYFRIPDEYQNSPDAFFDTITNNKNYLEDNTWFGHKDLFDGRNLRLLTGHEITFHYLQDDLWETEQVDKIFNEATFLMGKLFPTNYERTASMGNSAVWNLLISTWSYEKKLAIPVGTQKRKFVGGLSRVLLVGFAKRILKLDYSALYPSIELTHLVFPEFDFTHAIFRILRYLKLNRDHFKALSGDKSLPEAERAFYKVKQLPLKILNNSNFGAMGSEFMNWADMNVAERITCTGRQYLRSMQHFFLRWGLKPLVCDSVTGDTPVYIKYLNGDIDIQPISGLFDHKSNNKSDDGLRDYSEKPYQILTRNGWKRIGYVYRHGTNKQLHKIQTGNRQIKVTEDHSLFQHGKEIAPKDLKKGDHLDIYHLPELPETATGEGLYGNKLTPSLAWVYGLFLGDGSALHGTRNQYYYSKRKKEKVCYHSKGRADWKISNQNIVLLEKAQGIIALELGLETRIKDHRKSSSVFNLVSCQDDFVKFFTENFYTDYREKKVPCFILNANKEIKKAFLDGFVAADGNRTQKLKDRLTKNGIAFETERKLSDSDGMTQKSEVSAAGLVYLLKSLGIDWSVNGRSDKPKINRLIIYDGSLPESKRRTTKPEIIKSNTLLAPEEYVYDVSTEDGTFIAGIGGVIAHNTDGMNFVVPATVDKDINLNPLPKPIRTEELTYIDKKGDVHTGTSALVEKFNEEVMWGPFMKLDNDGEWVSCINVSKKNYANLEEDGSIKYTGNSIKSSTMSEYIEKFLDKALTMILTEKPVEFVEHYYSYLEKIANCEIPLSQIASKSKVKKSVMDYINRGFDTSGKYLPKQAHMELIMETHMESEDYKGLSKWLEIHVDLQGPKCGTAISKFSSLVSAEEVYKKLSKKKERFLKYLYELIEENGDITSAIGLETAQLTVKLVDKDKYKKVIKENKSTAIVEAKVYTIKKSFIAQAIKSSGEELEKFKEKAKEIKFPYDTGDTVYYINVGTSRLSSDSAWDANGRLMSRMISAEDVEKNPEKTGEYNIPKYVDAFNKRIEILLIVFPQDVRETMLKDVTKVKNKLSKSGFDFLLPEREYYTSDQLVLQSEIKDTVEELNHMEDREVDFWNITRLDPREIYPGFTHSKPLWYEAEGVECRSREEVINETVFDGMIPSQEVTQDEEYEHCLLKLQTFFYQRGARVDVYRSLEEMGDAQDGMVLKRESSGINLYSKKPTGGLAFEKTIRPQFYQLNNETEAA